jgi:mono/diheme cytochrome c family protein
MEIEMEKCWRLNMNKTSTYGLALALFFTLTACSRAEDTAALYKSKCATCHAPDGSGRKVMKGTNLLSDEARKMSDAQLTEAIAEGGAKKNQSHAYETKGLSSEQTSKLVGYIRELQKKAK